MQYRREIDGLRAIAVLPVILFHAGFERFSGGFVGVDVFFVISGYLITGIILEERARGSFSLLGFYERRARRILPALFLVLAACIPFALLWMLPDDLKEFSQSLVAVSAFASNFFFALKSGYFDTVAELKPLLHTWSLAVEEQYYVIFPLLLMLFWWIGRRGLIVLLLCLALASFAMAEWSASARYTEAFYLLPTRAWELLIGAVIALFHFEYGRREQRSLIGEIGGILGICLIGYAVLAFDETTPFPSVYSLAPTMGAALIILFATSDSFAGRLLGWRGLVGIGLISYSAYLWHQPLFAFARLRTYGEPGNWLLLALGVAALVLAYFSWRFVEQPYRNRQKVSRRMIFSQAAAATAFIVAGGMAGHLTNGLQERFNRNNDTAMIAKVEALDAERRSLIRAGECYFNTQGKFQEISAFLENWDCLKDPQFPALSPIPVVVVGDSHSADIVVSLKLNGMMPLQMGGADCSIVPRLMTRECLLQFDYLKQRVAGDPAYRAIILVNRLGRDELTEGALAEAVDYWQETGKELVFMTGIPDFLSFEHKLATGIEPRANYDLSQLSETPAVLDYLRSRSVHIINTREIFCSLAPDCGYRDTDGNFLLVDQEHLSKVGARKFGAKLLQDDLFKRSDRDIVQSTTAVPAASVPQAN